MVNMQTRMRYKSKQRGFSLIEVLVTLLIVASAVLGSAGLQAYALKINVGGQYRNQAVFLMEDMVERMQTNKAFSVGSTSTAGYDTSLASPSSTNCVTTTCSPSVLAVYDVTQWETNIASTLPPQVNALGTPTKAFGTVSQTSVGNLTTNTPSTYIVTVNWGDRKSNVKNAGTKTTENFVVTTTVTIGN